MEFKYIIKCLLLILELLEKEKVLLIEIVEDEVSKLGEKGNPLIEFEDEPKLGLLEKVNHGIEINGDEEPKLGSLEKGNYCIEIGEDEEPPNMGLIKKENPRIEIGEDDESKLELTQDEEGSRIILMSDTSDDDARDLNKRRIKQIGLPKNSESLDGSDMNGKSKKKIHQTSPNICLIILYFLAAVVFLMFGLFFYNTILDK
jgi:hypothetical protein